MVRERQDIGADRLIPLNRRSRRDQIRPALRDRRLDVGKRRFQIENPIVGVGEKFTQLGADKRFRIAGGEEFRVGLRRHEIGANYDFRRRVSFQHVFSGS